MKESDPSGMGGEESLPQFITFREITGDGKERGITGESSRFPELRRRSCEFRENKMAGIHRTKSGRWTNNRESQRSAKCPLREFSRAGQCMRGRKLLRVEERTSH